MSLKQDSKNLTFKEMGMEAPIKRGKLYYCPFDCSDKRFPKKKWKTEKAAIRHVHACYLQPEAIKEREENAAIKKEQQEKEASINNKKAQEIAKYKVGEMVYYVDYYVTKPTHEQRGSRMVKVRYEEERRYIAKSAVIETITGSDKAVWYNGCIPQSGVMTWKEAEKQAAEIQKAHLESNDFAARCR